MTTQLIIRLTHTGLYPDGRPNTHSVLVNDLDVGYEFQLRKVPCYVPFEMPAPYPLHTPGFLDIPASSRSLLSLADGVVKKFVVAGVLTADLFVQPAAFSNITRPAASRYPVGSPIWNTSDNALNYSDGAAWRDAMGVLT